jgi:hypothetical protein
VQAFFDFPFPPLLPPAAIPFRTKGLQNAAMPEAIASYTVSGLDDREILARTAVAPDVRSAEWQRALPAGAFLLAFIALFSRLLYSDIKRPTQPVTPIDAKTTSKGGECNRAPKA